MVKRLNLVDGETCEKLILCLRLGFSCTPFMSLVLVGFDVSLWLMHRNCLEIFINLLLGGTSIMLRFALVAASWRFPADRALDPGHLF